MAIPDLPENVLERRHALNLSQEALAYKARTSVATIGRLERGERVPSLKILARIAAVLEVPVEKLVASAA